MNLSKLRIISRKKVFFQPFISFGFSQTKPPQEQTKQEFKPPQKKKRVQEPM